MKRSFELYEQAAKQGLPKAQSLVAAGYYHGLGVKRDLKKAVQWYKTGAASGDPNAQYNLGAMYEQVCTRSDAERNNGFYVPSLRTSG
jgi:uncharacterized protein